MQTVMEVKNRKAPLFIQQFQFDPKQHTKASFKHKSSISTQLQPAFYSSRYSKIHTQQKGLKHKYRSSQQNIFPSINKQQHILNKKLSIVYPSQIPIIQQCQAKRKIKHLRNKSEKYLEQISKLKQIRSFQKIFFINNLCFEKNSMGVTQHVTDNIEELEKIKEQIREKRNKKVSYKKNVVDGPQQLVAKKIGQHIKVFGNKNEFKLNVLQKYKKRMKHKKEDQQINPISGWNIPSLQRRTFFEDF